MHRRALLLTFLALSCSSEEDPPSDVSAQYADSFEVIVDPYGINPLAAIVNVGGLMVDEVDRVEVTVAGVDASPEFLKIHFPNDPAHEEAWDSSDVVFQQRGLHVPVIGLIADVENQVDVVVYLKRNAFLAKRLAIATRLATNPLDDCRNCYPQIEISVQDLASMEPGWTMVEFSVGAGGHYRTRPLVFDEAGQVRWILYLDTLVGDWVAPIVESLSGNLITGRFDQIYEFNRLGRIVRTFTLPGYRAHHEIVEIREGPRVGNLVIAVDADAASTIEDHVVEVNRASGRIVKVWDLRDILDPTRTVLVNNATDWFHHNGTAYSPQDDCIILSGRNQGVAKIDRPGNLVWILAPKEGWISPQFERLLTAVDASANPYSEQVQKGHESVGTGAEFDWPWGQHAPSLLPNGDLLLFDNGFRRQFDTVDRYSRAVVYRIDEAALTVRQIWEYGSARGADYYSSIISNAKLLPATGNTLVQPGFLASPPGAIVSEVTSDGRLVFEARLTFVNAQASGTGWGSSDISYRAHRIRL